jgi:hypothetical protein
VRAMKVAIMQPYFLPYIGYFQLIGAVDRFVIYDNIKYTKKGWINRNRFLRDGRDEIFSLPLKKDSDALDVRERRLAADFDRDKLLNKLADAYRRAPQFDAVFPLLQRIFGCGEDNLFGFIKASLVDICTWLNIRTPMIVSSTLDIDNNLRGQDRVLAICRDLGADTYINAIGGRALYSKEAFAAQGINLYFLQSRLIEYPQFGQSFVPWLSIFDVMMFNAPESISRYLIGSYDLV